MMRYLPALGIVVLLLPAVLRAAEPPKEGAKPDALALTAKINKHLAARWEKAVVKPAATTDDADFFRRVNLDLIGKIPYFLKVRDFVDDDRPDKRRIWIDELLKDERFGGHWASVWTAWLLEQATSEQASAFAGQLTMWLAQKFKKNAPYDEMVRELLTAPINDNKVATPSAFLRANDLKVESLAGNTSRLFLGVKLECAQCHNHPFGKWTRQQFWEYAAFFAGLNAEQNSDDRTRREITIPGGDKIAARFLDGSAPKWEGSGSGRETLAAWVTRADNPFFAKAAVNRVWSYFFGIGLIEPLDEPSEQNPPSHPELLDELAKDFAASGFDLKFLIRAIVNSKAYQLTSASRAEGHDDPRLFARMPVRGLSPEQIFDSLAEATEYENVVGFQSYDINGNLLSTPRIEFLARFTTLERKIDQQTTILQALMLMNGRFMANVTSLHRNRALAEIASSKKRLDGTTITTADKIETLYLMTLTRLPRPEETARLEKYIDSGGATGHHEKALADVMWALLNCGEFLYNR